jgi:hypothetical protein
MNARILPGFDLFLSQQDLGWRVGRDQWRGDGNEDKDPQNDHPDNG